MEIQRLNRSDGEKIFMTFRNSRAVTTSAGHWLAIDMTTDKDGVGVEKAVGVLRNRIAGVCMESLAANAYGKFQVWGVCTIAKAKGATTLNTDALTAGVPLAIATSALYPTKMGITSAVAKADYAKQGAIGYAMSARTAANYSAATSSVYTVFVTCL
jgi:hypothetical protein